MPEQLLGRIIRISSNFGDLVVDPFAGSGTTLAVAKKLGRQYLGVELSKDYVSRIQARLDGCKAVTFSMVRMALLLVFRLPRKKTNKIC